MDGRRFSAVSAMISGVPAGGGDGTGPRRLEETNLELEMFQEP